MFCELGKNCVGAIAGMNRDIGVDEISQGRATPSIPPAQRNIDRLPFFNALGLWHAAQGGHRILQTVASGKNGDDVTQSRNFKIDVGIRIGKLGRDANGLTIVGFECASPRHLEPCSKIISMHLGMKMVPPMGILIHVYTALAIKPRDAGTDVELTAPFRSAEFLRKSVSAR